MLKYEVYSDEVATLAIYPFANAGNVSAVLYPTLGLNGEAGELLEKVLDLPLLDFNVTEVLKEAGDVLWYLTRVSVESGYSLSEIVESVEANKLVGGNDEFTEVIEIILASTRISEKMKKALRDDNGDIHAKMDDARREAIRDDLVKIAEHLIRFSLSLGSSLEEIAVINLEKLNSRASRNLINGDGDNR